MSGIVKPVELADARRALGEVRAALPAVHPALTWRPADWMAAASALQAQLGHLPGVLHALRASPASRLRARPPGGALGAEDQPRGPAAPRPAAADPDRGPDRAAEPNDLAQALRGPGRPLALTAGDFLDAVDELLDLLQTQEEPT
jgi:hypothetical protein